MTDAAKQAQREYMRRWRQKNPERVRAKNQRYWEKKARQLQAEKEAVNDGEKGI